MKSANQRTGKMCGKTGRAALALACIATLVGCEVGPNYQAPKIAVNPNFGEAEVQSPRPEGATTQASATQPSQVTTRTPPVAEWWTNFHDPILDELIQQAVKSNLDLVQARSRVVEARENLTIASGGEYPYINGSGSYTHSRLSKTALPITGGYAPTSGGSAQSTVQSSSGGQGGITPMIEHASADQTSTSTSSSSSTSGGFSSLFPTEFDLYQVGFDSSWEIDVFGGIRRGIEASQADLAASVEDQRDVLVTLLAEVARDYIQLRGYQLQLQIAQENLAAQQQTLSLTREKARVGVSTYLDVDQQAAQVANTASTIPTLFASERRMIHALGVLLGEDPMALAQQLERTEPIPAPPAEVPVGLPVELLRRRPDIRRAERQLAASVARVGVATADLYPAFSLTGSFAWVGNEPKNIFETKSISYGIGPSITIPLFDAGRLRANLDVSNQEQAQAVASYRQTVLNALSDVEDSLVAYSTEQVRQHALQDAVDAQKEAVGLATDQYNQGTTDFITVLDAQRSLFESEDELAQSQSLVSTDLVSLYKALGGGWEIQPEQDR